VFDRTFFETGLSNLVTEKAKHSSDGTVTVKLFVSSGESFSVIKIVEVADGYVVIEPFPPDGKLRPYPKDERGLGAPQFDLDRLAIPYERITDVLITTRRQRSQKMGFQA
jgi:hypothetical protein